MFNYILRERYIATIPICIFNNISDSSLKVEIEVKLPEEEYTHDLDILVNPHETKSLFRNGLGCRFYVPELIIKAIKITDLGSGSVLEFEGKDVSGGEYNIGAEGVVNSKKFTLKWSFQPTLTLKNGSPVALSVHCKFPATIHPLGKNSEIFQTRLLQPNEICIITKGELYPRIRDSLGRIQRVVLQPCNEISIYNPETKHWVENVVVHSHWEDTISFNEKGLTSAGYATKIQSTFRGFWTRKIIQEYTKAQGGVNEAQEKLEIAQAELDKYAAKFGQLRF